MLGKYYHWVDREVDGEQEEASAQLASRELTPVQARLEVDKACSFALTELIIYFLA